MINMPATAQDQLQLNNHAVDSFQDCDDCPVMIKITAKDFYMGNDLGKKAERPRHLVKFNDNFALAQNETSFDQYNACVMAGGCEKLPWDRDWGRALRPVIYVNYQDAVDYAAWLAKITGKDYRLPNEIEWEFAAWGGVNSKKSPTGYKIANCHGCVDDWAHMSFAVGKYPANPYGLYDMLGNVMEWTSSCWQKNYHKNTKIDCKRRVRRGGSWYFNQWVSTPTYRYGGRIDRKNYDIGFRVALSMD